MEKKPKERPLHILLADDDSTDRELFIEAAGQAGTQLTITEAANGMEALNYLSGVARMPDLVILDLNMPLKDGRETLREIRGTAAWRYLPVCILSTSSAHFDIIQAYEGGANLFLVKPFDFGELVGMLQSLLTLFGQYVMPVHNPAGA